MAPLAELKLTRNKTEGGETGYATKITSRSPMWAKHLLPTTVLKLGRYTNDVERLSLHVARG